MFLKPIAGIFTIGLNASLLSSRILASASMSTTRTSNDYLAGSNSVAFVTTPDETIAKKLARGIIQEKLAACVNIIPKVTSIYEWEGALNEDSEVLLMIKTSTSKINELTEYVRKNHPYTVAEVISLPIENGNPPYLDWVAKSVK